MQIEWIGSVVVPAIVAVISAGTTIWLAKKSNADLENDEVRRRKVEIIYSLLGSRYVLSSNYPASSDEVKVFNTSMSLFGVFFSSDRAVSRAYDAFKTTKSDENLLRMLQSAGQSLGIDLLDSMIKDVLTVVPRPLPTVVLPLELKYSQQSPA
jgi:hypothetical protein